MLNFEYLMSWISMWVLLFSLVSYVVRINLDIKTLRFLHRRIIRLLDGFGLFIACLYQIYSDYSATSLNKQLIESIVHSQLSIYIYEVPLYFFWLKNFEIPTIFHHLLSICTATYILHFELWYEIVSYELALIESANLISHSKELLKTIGLKQTKTVIIFEYIYPFAFFVSKIILRGFLMYYEIFIMEIKFYSLIILSLFLLLFLYWSWFAWKSFTQKISEGFLSWNNFHSSPWLVRIKKLE